MLLYHALRCDELCKLTIKNFKHERRGVAHLKVASKSGNVRYVPLHLAANGLVNAGLDQTVRRSDRTCLTCAPGSIQAGHPDTVLRA